MKNNILTFCFFLCIVAVTGGYAQECVMCYKSDGSHVSPGRSWTESRNGTTYNCTCTSSGPRCTSSSSGGSGGGYSSGNSTQDIMTSVVANAFQNLLNNLFSSSDNSSEESSSNSGSTTSAYTGPSQEEIDAAIARQKAWKEQVDKLQSDYKKVLNEKFADQQKSTADDFKNRFVKSEATKAIKQLNCAAQKHIGDARLVLNGSVSLKELNTPLEDARSSADFTQKPDMDCQPIEVKIPEVTVQNPVGFQQMMYQTIQSKADSITIAGALLKQRQTNLKKTIEEKQQEVKTIEQQPKNNNDTDKLKAAALAALQAANDEEKTVEDEIVKSQKGLDALEKLRSTYDIKDQKK